MELRSYQRLAVAHMLAMVTGPRRRCVYVAPTGSGKTVIFCAAIEQLVARGFRVAVIVERNDLVQQTHKHLIEDGGLDPQMIGVINAGDRASRGGLSRVLPEAAVQVCSVQTLAGILRRGECLPEFQVLVVDECHHVAAESYKRLFAMFPSAWIIGCTATPQRGDGKALGVVFDELLEIVRYSQLLALPDEERPIVGCDVYRPPIDCLVDGLAQDPLFAWMRYALGTKAMVYVRSIAEAESTCTSFNAAGVACGVVHSEMDARERALVMERFRSNELLVLVNVYVLTEGINIPDVETIVLARKCEHAGTFVQIAGRALRAFPGKRRALLIDLTGASYRHGLPTDDREHSLDGAGVGDAIASSPCVGRALDIERSPSQWQVLDVDLVSADGSPVRLTLPTKFARLEMFARMRGYPRAWVNRVMGALPGALSIGAANG